MKLSLKIISVFSIMLLTMSQSILPAQDVEDDVLELQPFVVSTFDTTNYLASEISSGTRYSVRLQDIPFPVSLVTSEMMDDFLAFDFNDAATFTSGFSPSEGTGRFFLRGIASRSTYKNGVRGNGLYGSAFVDRIELIRGPNAAIYGQTEPSGLRNVITKRPGWDPSAELRLIYGTDDYIRAYAGASVPVVKDLLAVRADAFWEESEQRSIDHWFSDQKGGYLAARWKPTGQTLVDFNIERIDSRHANPMYQTIVLDGNTGASLGLLGMHDIQGFEKDDYYGHSFAGSKAFNDVEVTTLDAIVNHRINDVFSVRLTFNWWQRYQDVVGIQGRPVINSLDRSTSPVSGGTSFIQFFQKVDNEQWVGQVDLLAQFKTGQINHKLLCTFDHLDFDLADVALAQLLPVFSVDADDYDLIGDVFDIPPYLTDSFRNLITEREIDGILLSERAIFLEGRAIAMVGMRYDNISEANTPRQFIPGSDNEHQIGEKSVRPDVSDTTYQAGFIYKPTDQVSLYASYSESFNPGNAQDLDFDGNPLGNQEGSGYEFGIKGSLLAQRLNFTLGYYTIEKGNLTFTATDANGSPLPPASGIGGYKVTGKQESNGFELDLTYAPTNTTLFGLSMGTNNVEWASISEDAPRQQFLVGRPPEGVPDFNLALWIRHEVKDGPLAGFNVRAAARYQGEAVVDATFTDASGNLFMVPDYYLVDLGIGYRFSNDKLEHRFDLNIKNLFDEEYFRGPYAGFPFSAYISYAVGF